MTSKKSASTSTREWLGFADPINYSNSKTLGRVLGRLIVFFAFLLVILLIIVIVDFFQAGLRVGPFKNDIDGSAVRNTGLVLVAMLGAPFIVWRTIVASKQASIADEAQFNEKVERAQTGLSARYEVSHLQTDGVTTVVNQWVDDLVTRAAALDRLEGLVAERPETAPRMVKIIAAYVRGNFPAKDLVPTEPFERKTPRLDLQRAIDVIGRVQKIAVSMDTSHWRLDLRGCDLDGVNFEGGYFWAADFSGCRIEGSYLSEANFEGCLFRNTLLNYSTFWRANLIGVRFDGATLNRPNTLMPGSPYCIALGYLTGATFSAADISALTFLGTPEKISETFGTKDTQVSIYLNEKRPDEGKHANVVNRRLTGAFQASTEVEVTEEAEVDATGFQNWSPWNSFSNSTDFLLEKLYEKLDMKRWPYW